MFFVLVCIVLAVGGTRIVTAALDGLLMYGEGTVTTPRYRIWNTSIHNWSDELNAPDLGVGNTVEWVEVRGSPQRDEYTAVVASALDDVKVMLYSKLQSNGTLCWHNSTDCDAMMNLTLGSSIFNMKKMAVAYEDLSGDALITFSTNNRTPGYITWNGSSWSGIQYLSQNALTGTATYLTLVPRLGSNEIAFVYADSLNDLVAYIWNGTDWACNSTGLTLNLRGTASKKFDAVYEYNSGDLLIAYSPSANTDINYTEKQIGSCTFTTTTATAPTLDPDHISLASQIGSDYVLMGYNQGGATDDFESIVWNGTEWINKSNTELSIYATEVSINLLSFPSWIGSSEVGLVVYSDATGTNVEYFLYNRTGQVWKDDAGGGIAYTPTPALSAQDEVIKSYTFMDENKSMILIRDENDDFWAKIFNNSNNNLTDTEGATMEGSLSSAEFPTFDFAWRMVNFYNPPPTISSFNVSPFYPGYTGLTVCNATILDPKNGSVTFANFTVYGGNGSLILNGTNGTANGNIWTSATFNTTHPGSWNCTITAGDNTHVVKQTTFFSVGGKGGIIPMNSGTPFYTTTTNPFNCGYLNHNDVCQINWTINATGNPAHTYEFFTYANSTDNNATSNQTIRLNITITRPSAPSNTLPTAPVQLSPANGSSITNRTPVFSWANATDADGNPVSYHLQVDDNAAFNNPEINVSSLPFDVGTPNTTYYPSTELNVDTTYYWRVRANDSTDYGDFSSTANFTLSSLLQISFTNNAVEFGSLGRGANVSTVTGSPRPFRAENTGNINFNVSINASALFSSVAMNSSFYQFRARENESNSFHLTLSATDWTNMSTRTDQAYVVNLTWRAIKNDFLIDLNLSLPLEEPFGVKRSTITFTITGYSN